MGRIWHSIVYTWLIMAIAIVIATPSYAHYPCPDALKEFQAKRLHIEDPEVSAALEKAAHEGQAARDLVELNKKLYKKTSHLDDLKFSPEEYQQATNKMKAQVDQWILEAEKNLASLQNEAGEVPVPTELVAKLNQAKRKVEDLKNHRRHLRGLTRDLYAHADEFRSLGQDIDRLELAIWTHDIGKFVNADPLIVNRHAIRALAKGGDEYLKAANPGISEARIAEVRAAVKKMDQGPGRLLELLKEGSGVSEELNNYIQWMNGRQFFAEFLDHAETSREWLRQNPLFGFYTDANGKEIPDNMSRQAMLDSYGHDGPAAPGSFWGNYYPLMTGRIYPNPKTDTGHALRALDRGDQSAVAISPRNGVIGGPRKIAAQVRDSPLNQELPSNFTNEQKASLAEVNGVWEALKSVPDGTRIQAEYIDVVESVQTQRRVPQSQIDQTKRVTEMMNFMRGKVRFYNDVVTKEVLSLEKTGKYRNMPVIARPQSAPPEAIGYIEVGPGIHIHFNGVDDFYQGTNGQPGVLERAIRAYNPVYRWYSEEALTVD